MSDAIIPPYDESKEIEIIYDFHNSQLWRINTTNANTLLEYGKEFDKGIMERLDEQKRCRLIYVIDQMPPLTAILRHMENPFDIEWAVMAFVINKTSSFMQKASPIISYGLGLTKYKHKFIVGVFDAAKHRNDLTQIIKWQDANMEIKPIDHRITWY